jgi:hypothetical protein
MFHTKNLTEMNFIRTVANPQQAAPRQSLVNRGIIRTAHGAEHLHGAIGYQSEAPGLCPPLEPTEQRFFAKPDLMKSKRLGF